MIRSRLTRVLAGCLKGAFQGVWAAARSHGSAGWEHPPPGRLLKPNAKLAPGSFVIGAKMDCYVALNVAEAQRHGIIVGGSGTGKSRGFFLPNASLSRQTSIVCTDPKSELWRITAGTRERAIRFAPADPERSSCFNWIPACSEPAIAELCARAIVESGNTQSTEQAWLDTETALLSAVFGHASTLTQPTPLSAYRLITRQPIDSLTRVLLASPCEGAREHAMVFSQTQEKMRGSIVPVVAAKLQFLRDPNVARFTSASITGPNLKALREVPTALYWCLREADIARLRPLTSLFFSLLLESLATGNEDGEGVPTILLLDEFANIGVIPHFDTIISLARGRGVAIWMGIQSLGQLEARYGKANAQTILSNCSTKIALSGLDVESAEYFSRALGDKTEVIAKKSRHGLLSPTFSHSKSEHSRRLLTADEVRRIATDEAIVIFGNRKPMMLEKIFWQHSSRAAEPECLGSALAVDVAPLESREPPALPQNLFRKSSKKRTDSLTLLK